MKVKWMGKGMGAVPNRHRPRKKSPIPSVLAACPGSRDQPAAVGSACTVVYSEAFQTQGRNILPGPVDIVAVMVIVGLRGSVLCTSIVVA